MTIENLHKIKTCKCLDSVNIEPINRYFGLKNPFWNKELEWSLDDFGPLVIPAKGMRINLNRSNLLVYSETIKKYEKVNIELINGMAFIKGKVAYEFAFKQDYYFFVGDNRYNSIDSRSFGIIPKSMIIGKASRILIPYNLKLKDRDLIFKKL